MTGEGGFVVSLDTACIPWGRSHTGKTECCQLLTCFTLWILMNLLKQRSNTTHYQHQCNWLCSPNSCPHVHGPSHTGRALLTYALGELLQCVQKLKSLAQLACWSVPSCPRSLFPMHIFPFFCSQICPIPTVVPKPCPPQSTSDPYRVPGCPLHLLCRGAMPSFSTHLLSEEKPLQRPGCTYTCSDGERQLFDGRWGCCSARAAWTLSWVHPLVAWNYPGCSTATWAEV